MSGGVRDSVSGAALSGVVVAVQGKSATTGTDGRYSISDLTAGQTQVTAQRQGHRNFTQAVTLAGATTVDITMTSAQEAGAAGSWTGRWTNNTFGSSGTMTMTLAANTIAQTMQMTLDVNGSVFGGSDPAAETTSGAYTPEGATVTKTSLVFGNVTFTISSTGQITGNGTNVPSATVSRIDFTGTATPSTMNLNYTVTFRAGGTATGVATLTRQ
ncbi:MAG: carboxypeptidase regulatory-like domain-containing protein [Acidobacteria bacterium]|nr:carboxypeptidase regulatory-like domain-containing protein [Acidobacteriota bacterium]